MTPEAVYDLGVRADQAEVEAVVLSCTDMRAVEVIGRLEKELKKPVVTSNQALMHVARRRLGLEDRSSPIPGALGRVPTEKAQIA